MLMNHAQFKALLAGLDWRRVRAIEARCSAGKAGVIVAAKGAIMAAAMSYATTPR